MGKTLLPKLLRDRRGRKGINHFHKSIWDLGGRCNKDTSVYWAPTVCQILCTLVLPSNPAGIVVSTIPVLWGWGGGAQDSGWGKGRTSTCTLCLTLTPALSSVSLSGEFCCPVSCAFECLQTQAVWCPHSWPSSTVPFLTIWWFQKKRERRGNNRYIEGRAGLRQVFCFLIRLEGEPWNKKELMLILPYVYKI